MPKMNPVENSSQKYSPQFNANQSNLSTELKTAAGMVAGAWALKKFPKIAMIGLIGVGVLIGLTLKEVARSVDRFPRRNPDDLH